jgi:hypothetical protein
MSEPNPTASPTAPESPGIGMKVKEQFRKAGRAVDRGMANILKEVGQNIRTVCPGCSKTVEAPADELVECPMCKTHFQSPTVSARTAEIGRTVKHDIEQKLKSDSGPPPESTQTGTGRPSGA